MQRHKQSQFSILIVNKLIVPNYFIEKTSSYYFLLPISTESIVFGSNFRNGDFDGLTRFEVL